MFLHVPKLYSPNPGINFVLILVIFWNYQDCFDADTMDEVDMCVCGES